MADPRSILQITIEGCKFILFQKIIFVYCPIKFNIWNYQYEVNKNLNKSTKMFCDQGEYVFVEPIDRQKIHWAAGVLDTELLLSHDGKN